MEKIKNIFKTIFGVLIASIGLITITVPFVNIFSILMILVGIKTGQDGLMQNDIKNSCFIVKKKKKDKISIYQNLFDLNNLIKSIFYKNKQDFFTIQALNMYAQLKPYTSDGKSIEYSTTSQAYSLMLLKRMEKYGYVENLESKFINEKSLPIERFLFGLKKRDRKIKMFDIKFNLTNRCIDDQSIEKLTTYFKIDLNNYKKATMKNGSIVWKPIIKNNDQLKKETQELNENYNFKQINTMFLNKIKLYRSFQTKRHIESPTFYNQLSNEVENDYIKNIR
ncbi:MAG: hypothetical protein RSB72_01455 [Bacilli bacterium]